MSERKCKNCKYLIKDKVINFGYREVRLCGHYLLAADHTIYIDEIQVAPISIWTTCCEHFTPIK